MHPELRVLVVDDDPDIRGLLCQLLEDEGFRVSTAACGLEAVAQARDFRPDLVMVDLMMPGLDGEGAIRQLRARCGKNLPVILMSSSGKAPEAAKRLGSVPHIDKPFELDRLLRLVRQGIAHSHSVPSTS